MAKGNAFLSVQRGKLGNTVGYKVGNSNNKELQGWRAYQPVVSNPKTDLQLAQRIKLLSVNNAYRAFKSLIDRGQEGVEYGDASRRKFLSRALSSEFAGPWLIKGNTMALPLKDVDYTVGSLPSLEYSNAAQGWSLDGLQSPSAATAATLTLGMLSAAFVSAGYQTGDQVTFAYGYIANGSATNYMASFYVDTSDTRLCTSVFHGLTFDEVAQGQTFSGLFGGSNTENWILVSVAREGSHLRSTQRFAVYMSPDAYYSALAYNASIDSYRTASAQSTSDWEQSPDGGAVTVTINGSSVAVKYMQQVGDYWLINGQYYVKCNDVYYGAYGDYLASPTSWRADAPAGQSAANTFMADGISRNFGEGYAFFSWLISSGQMDLASFISPNIIE